MIGKEISLEEATKAADHVYREAQARRNRCRLLEAAGYHLGTAIVMAARSWAGTPFRHAERTKGLGVDCAGLVLGVARELGLTDWDFRNYSRQVNCEFMRRQIELFCDPVEGEPEPGDLLLLAIHGHPQHLALYAGDGMMIHAHESAGMVVEHRFDEFWQRRLRGIYRWRL